MAKQIGNGDASGSQPAASSPQQELQPTLGSQMRQMREQGVVLTFPSGNRYRVRTVGAAALLRRGNLPNVLLAFVIDAIYYGVDGKKIDQFFTLQEREENAAAFVESLNVCCDLVFMEPRIVENPTADDECSIDDIPIQDRSWAFDLAFGVARELRPFRDEQEADVDSVPVAQDVPQAA